MWVDSRLYKNLPFGVTGNSKHLYPGREMSHVDVATLFSHICGILTVLCVQAYIVNA